MDTAVLKWHLWSPDEIASKLPALLDQVSTSIGVFTEEHQEKNRAAIESLRGVPPAAASIREGQFERELITLGFALDVLGRRAAAEAAEDVSLELFRAAHELFRGGNAAMRPSAPMKQALTNALKVGIAYEIKRVVAGETDVGLAKDDLEQFVASAWGSVPPQLALTISEMLLTALERSRVEGEMDVTFHERLVRDNVAAVLAMEVPTRLEAVRSRWEDIGQHIAPAAVRVAQKNLRRPDSLSTLLPAATWDAVRQAVAKGDGDELRIALQAVEDSLETNLRLRLDAKAEYREPSSELRYKGGIDEFFLEARDLLLRRDSRALEKFSNIHFHKSNNAIAKEWYAYARVCPKDS